MLKPVPPTVPAGPSRRKARRAAADQLGPTPERLAKGDVFETVETARLDSALPAGVRASRCITQTPIDRYVRRQQIDHRQWQAASRLRVLWRAAGIEPRVVANLLGAGGRAAWADTVVRRTDAETRLIHVTRAVGDQLTPVLIHVVGLEQPASGWAALKGYRGTSADLIGLATLRLALDALADHWGLT